MKRFFGYVTVLMVMLFVCISCSHNSGLPAGNVKVGSSSDPFVDSQWTLSKGNSSSKIIEFQTNGNYVYGTSYGGYGGMEMKGKYSVTKNGNECD